MDEKSIRTLEYHKVTSAVAGHCSFGASRELAETLHPYTSLDEVERAQSATSEARRLLELRPDISVKGARDIRSLVARADLGGMLEAPDFLPIASTVEAGRSLKRQVAKLQETTGELPLLRAVAGEMYGLDELHSSIRSSIGERGDVLDTASPALGRIRVELRRAHDRLQELLRSILTSSTYAQAIQEPIITLREGRYVIPVKADFRSRIPGIVHDTSGSGQTLFVEPLGAVDAGNRWREMQGREADEIERILRALTSEVAAAAPELLSTVSALARLDFALAKARYAGRLGAVRPAMHEDVRSDANQPRFYLPEARHPLLRGNVVPISLELGGAYRVLVITGPNTGGKTVALKTAGLLALMAQSGLHVPTGPGARLQVLSDVYADIGDEQSIEQSLSTFSSHVTNIIRMLGAVGPRSLVLLDELGAGTDPEEGSALARALLDHLLERGCLAVATTHYSELKSYAHTNPGVRNASVEFDVETLSPTYRLRIGLPGKSNALAISGRLGMPREILERAQANVRPESRELNEMLQQIEDEREGAYAARAVAQKERDQARAIVDEARATLHSAAEERERATLEGHLKAQAELEEFRQELATLRREIQSAASAPEAAATVREAEERLRQLSRKSAPQRRRLAPAPVREITEGDTVIVRSLGSSGRVLSLSGNSAEVQLGSLKSRVPVGDLQLVEADASGRTPAARPAPRVEVSRPAPPMELDLRGQRAEEVERQLDRYVDDAYLAGLPLLRIIHGKGTGALRQVVRDFLRDHPLVDSLEGGGASGGGEGVTIASLSSR